MTSAREESVTVEKVTVAREYQGTARRVRRANWALVVGALAGWILDSKFAALFGVSSEAIDSICAGGAYLAVFLMLASFAVGKGFAARTATIRASGDGIDITHDERTEHIARTDLSHGLFSDSRAVAHFLRRNGNALVVNTQTVAEAESLIHAAGLDVAHQAVEFETSWFVDTLSRAIGFGITSACLGALVASRVASVLPHAKPFDELAFFATWSVLVTLGMLATTRPRIAIGADGVRAKRPFVTEFFSYPEIRTVDLEGKRDLVLVGHNGRRHRFDLTGVPDRERLALVDRIEQAREKFRRTKSEPTPAPQLEREGRSLADWKRELVKLAKQMGDYRTSTLSNNDLLRIVDDPSAPAERRIGAAVALGSGGDERLATRIRVAADACVSEPVKHALQKAADGALEEDDVVAAVNAERRAAR